MTESNWMDDLIPDPRNAEKWNTPGRHDFFWTSPDGKGGLQAFVTVFMATDQPPKTLGELQQ